VIVYLWFVFCFFIAFIVVHSGLLLVAAVELKRYAARACPTALRRALRSPLAAAIAIVCPAYNEEAGIIDSVRALLALDYPKIEVVVVNDGSTDGTLGRLTEVFDLRPIRRPTPPYLPHRPVRGVYAPRSRLPLLVIDKENGGKADSLNTGVNFTSCPLACAVDADSILEQDALAKAALPFIEDPERTLAAAGMIRIANGCVIDRGRVVEVHPPRSRWAMFQVVEYLRAFFAVRTGWAAIGALLIVSGAFGLFRCDVVIAAGGWRTDTVGEDFELVVRLHRMWRDARRPYRIVYVPDPVCWTEGPETARGLRSQRARWHRGCIETLLTHRAMLMNPRYGTVGLIALPAMLLFEVLGPVIELSGYVMTTATLLAGRLSVAGFLLFLAVAVLYGLLLTLGAIAMEDALVSSRAEWVDLRRVLLFALGEGLGYRQVLIPWRLLGVWQLIRKTQWQPMERKGFSAPPPAAVPQARQP
jgi:cellulose synthase/poly-beta-1,6-N-acetylglucosamine synthase-like glycosyltransferase